MSMSGIGWSLLQQGGRQAASLAVFAALSLLLDPSAFGLIAFAQVVIALVTITSELGFGVAIIQRQNVTPAHLSTAFTLNVGLGALLSTATILLAAPLAQLFRKPEAEPLLRGLAAGFVLSSVGMVQSALAQRELRFRDLALRDIAAQVGGGIVAIVLAVRGAGAWSLVAQALVAAGLGSLLLWVRSPWRPRVAEVSATAARELWSYGSRIVGFNFVKFLVQNTDRLTLAYVLDASQFGIYVYSSKLVLQTSSMLSGGIGGYLFPRLAQLQDRAEDAGRLLLRAQRGVLLLLAPVMMIAALLAPALLPRLLGPAWQAGVTVLQVLAAVACLQAVFAPIGELIKAFGQPAWLLRWGILLAAACTAGVAAGSPWGAKGAAAGLLVAHLACLPVLLEVARRLAGTRATAVARAVAPAGLAAATAALPFVAAWAAGLQLSVPMALGAGLVGGTAAATLVVRTLGQDPAVRAFLERRVRRADVA